MGRKKEDREEFKDLDGRKGVEVMQEDNLKNDKVNGKVCVCQNWE
jgi:hypothetical protein